MNSWDHKISIKGSFALSVCLNVGEVTDNNLSSMNIGTSRVILKDSNVQGLEPFRYAVELIKCNLSKVMLRFLLYNVAICLLFIAMKQTVLTKQSDGEVDYNNTSLRVALASILCVMRLKLIGIVLVRNAPGQSVFNLVEYFIGFLSLALIVLAMDRDEPKDKVIEDEIRKCRSIKKFVEVFKDTHPKCISSYE